MQKKIVKIGLYLLSFLLPLMILTVFAMELKLAPFGQKNLLSSDLSSQYVPFFSYFKNIILGHETPFYSFSFGMGSSSFALITYYLLSPFNFILLLFKDNQADIVLLWVIFLKIAAISSAMFFYLHQHFKKLDFSKLLFSLAYAFSSFVSLYLINLMWLDALILLPLVTWALEQLIQKKKGIYYTVLLFLTIVVNYYLSYMICLFLVLYFFYTTILTLDFKNWADYWRQVKPQFWSFTKYSIFAGLISLFILVPAGVGMLKTGKANNSILTFLPYPHFSFDIFQQLGIDNSNYATRLNHLPSFYVGGILILLVILYFQMSFSKKEKTLTGLFLLVLFSSFFIQTLNAVWHMFQMTAGFPFRNSFLFSFLLIIIAYQVWQRKAEISNKLLVRSLLVMIAFLSLGYATGLLANLTSLPIFFKGDLRLYAYALVLLCLNAFLLARGKHQALLLILMLDLSFSFYKDLSVIPGDTHQNFKKEYEVVKSLANSVKPNLDTLPLFYRMDNQVHFYNTGYNQSILYGFNGIESYSSTLNDQLRLTQKSLGQLSINERRISNVGLTNFTSYLFDVNYEIKPSILATDSQALKQKKGYAIYQKNAKSSSLGYFLPDLSTIDFSKTPDDYFNNQDELARKISGTPNFTLFSDEAPQRLGKNHYLFKTNDTGELLINLPFRSARKELSISVNGKTIMNKALNMQSGGQIKLGDVTAGEQIDLQLTSPTTELLTAQSTKILASDKLKELIRPMDEFKPIIYYSPSINEFRVSVGGFGDQHLFLSLPYDSNWVFKIDHRIAKARPTLNGAFTDVEIKKGDHELTISYQPKLFYVSLWISMISLVIFVALETSAAMNKQKLARLK